MSRVLLLIFSLLVFGCDAQISSFIGTPFRLSPNEQISGSDKLQFPATLEVDEGDDANPSLTYSPSSEADFSKKFTYAVIPVSAVPGVHYTSGSGEVSLTSAAHSANISIPTHEVGITGASSLDFKVQWKNSEGGVEGETIVKIKPRAQFKKIHSFNPIAPKNFEYIDMGAYVLFAKYSPSTGVELWRSDGTAGGTFLLLDICAGTCSSSPENFVKIGSTAYFTVEENGKKVIFKTDGTSGGTGKIFDLSQVTNSTNPNDEMLDSFQTIQDYGLGLMQRQVYLVADSNRVYFLMRNLVDSASGFGMRVMSTQGTLATTFMMDHDDDHPYILVPFNGRLFINREDDVLMWTGTTTNGGKTIYTPSPGNPCWGGSNVTQISNGLLFSVCLDLNGFTRKSIRIDSSFTVTYSSFTESTILMDGKLGSGILYYSYFNAGTYYLKRMNGAGGGIVQLISGTSNFYSLGKLGSNAIFVSGKSFYYSAGTVGTTALVKTMSSYPVGVGSTPTRFFLTLDGGAGGQGLYMSDLTSAGTNEVFSTDGESFGNIQTLFNDGSIIYFSAWTTSRGTELWKVDATNTISLVTEPKVGSNSSYPGQIVIINGTKYFTAVTPSGSVLYPIVQSPSALVAHALSPYDLGISESLYSAVSDTNQIYWTQSSFSGMVELYKYSSNSGAAPITVIDPGKALRTDLLATKDGKFLIPGGSTLFSVLIPGAFIDLNGTANLLSGSGNYPKFVAPENLGDGIVYAGHSSASGFDIEPYYFSFANGTATSLGDIVTGGASSNPRILGNLGGFTYFMAGASGARSLYKTDGTLAGTSIVKTTNSISETTVFKPAKLGNKIVFASNVTGSGSEMWVTDGTSAGTFLLKDIESGAMGSISDFNPGVVVGGKFYFNANDSTNGDELWVTDGTSAGTQLVKDICSGNCSSSPRYFFAIGSTLYFWTVVDNPTSMSQSASILWKSDGTSAGTVQMQDYRPLAASQAYTTSTSSFFVLTNNVTPSDAPQLFRFNPSRDLLPTTVPGYEGIYPTIFGVWNGNAIVRDTLPDNSDGLFLVK